MPNETDKPERPPERRGFLKALGLGAGAAAVAGSVQAAEWERADAAPPGTARKENAAERVKARYRETEDVKAFYRTNRY